MCAKLAEFDLKCKQCGQSTTDEESVWISNVKWPIKLMFGEKGLGFMTAELEEKDIVQLIDWSEAMCDKCQGTELERTPRKPEESDDNE